jgi:hypothetical protein
MKPLVKFKNLALLSTALVGLNACIIAPPHLVESTNAVASVSVTTAAPAPYYAAPSPGYAWMLHSRDGWGWRHPHRGWYHQKPSFHHRRHH